MVQFAQRKTLLHYHVGRKGVDNGGRLGGELWEEEKEELKYSFA